MYSIGLQRRARKALAQLPDADAARILTAVRALASTPRPHGCRKLTGRDAWRLSIGVYRVIYEINDDELTITVVDIGHRRDIYR